MKNIEMNKLAILLAKNYIPFEIYPYHIGSDDYFQLCYPNKTDCIIDAVSTPHTYGGRDGLIEIMCEKYAHAWDWWDDVKGNLTAEEAYKYFERADRIDF